MRRRRIARSRQGRPRLAHFESLEARSLLTVQPISLASSSFSGASANGASYSPVMSADGQVVVFTSNASNLVVGEANGFETNIYVRNGLTGAVSLLAVNKDGTASGNGPSSSPVVSADGRFVVFSSTATDLTAVPVTFSTQIYVRDLAKGTTTLVSINKDGTGGSNGNPSDATISADGRYVAFLDSGTNLTAGLVKNDKNYQDVYVRDLVSGTTTLVSANLGNTGTGNGGALSAVISGGGRFVAFVSDASDLAANDANKSTDVFVRDLKTGTTALASMNRYGTASGDGASGSLGGVPVVISPDGRYVTFGSSATDLTADNTSHVSGLYERDMIAGTTTLVSINSSGTGGSNNYGLPYVFSMTPDGRYVAFESDAGDLGGPKGGGFHSDIYIRDLHARSTILASIDPTGTASGDNNSHNPRISADGRSVIFSSDANNLVAGDTNNATDLFVRDLTTGTTRLVSLNAAGTGSGAGSSPADGIFAISADGRYVGFDSNAGDLVAGDNNVTTDVFERDLTTTTTVLVSLRSPALPARYTPHGSSRDPSISGDGRYIAFDSYATDIVPNQNNYPDTNVFVTDRQTGITTLVSADKGGVTAANNNSSSPLIAPGGRYVVYQSTASDLFAGQPATSVTNLFRFDLQTGTTIQVTLAADGLSSPNAACYPVAITPDARFVVFTSSATNLVAGYTLGSTTNLYETDLATGHTTLLSVDTAGKAGASASVTGGLNPGCVSTDGQVIAFVTTATNLVAGDADTTDRKVFVRNLKAGATNLLSVKIGKSGDAGYSSPVVSSDGRYVAFSSFATNLDPQVTDTVSFPEVYQTDLQSGTTRMVSVSADGTTAGDIGGENPSMSSDGHLVAFDSYSSNLAAGFHPTQHEVYVRDMTAHRTTLVSLAFDGTPASGYSPALSSDGSTVAFLSSATTLVRGFVANGTIGDLYVRNLAAGTTTLATASDSNTGGGNNDGLYGTPGFVLSADGSVVAFSTDSSNLYAGDLNGSDYHADDIYVATTTVGGGSISGQVFGDTNGDGAFNSGETGLAGWTVFLDANGNGTLDPGETSVVTDASGAYTFKGLFTGTYTVAEVLQPGYAETLPKSPGSYTVTLATDTTAVTGQNFGEKAVYADLVASAVVAPAACVAGGAVSVTWNVTNQGDGPASGTWQDAVFLSPSSTLDAHAILLTTVDHSGPLAIGASYSGAATATIPGILPGTYHILVQTDVRNEARETPNRTDNVTPASSATTISIPTLVQGTPLTDAFTGQGDARYYSFAASAGESLELKFTSLATSGSVELYLRHGAIATPYDYDLSQKQPGLPHQVLVIPYAQGGTYEILSLARGGSASHSGFTIEADQTGLSVLSIGTAQGGNTGRVTIPIHGSDFTTDAQVQLVSGAISLAPVAVSFQDASLLYATFDLSVQPIGTFDIQVSESGKTAALPSAFQIVLGQSNPLQVHITVPAYLRDNRPGTVVVDYVNTGNTDVPAELIDVSSTKAALGFSGQDALVGGDLQALTVSSDGPAGILRPGETGRIVLSAVSTTQTRHDQVPISLGTIQDNNLAIDFGSLQTSFQPADVPADAWAAVWANYMAEVGPTTGSYQASLAANATHLSQIGGTTSDVSQLNAFALLQANDTLPGATLTSAVDASYPAPGLALIFNRAFLQPLIGRYHLGPLGRGWATNWDISVSTDSQGNAIVEQGGGSRFFTKQGDGTYRGQPTDAGVLTLVNGAYQLRDTSGILTAFRTDGTFDYQQDLHGNRITAGYTGKLLTSLTQSDGSALMLTYNGQGRLASLTDPTGLVTTYSYDASGEHLISVTTPRGTTQYSYITNMGPEQMHALAAIAGPDGSHQFFQYDARGRLVGVSQDGGANAYTLGYGSAGTFTVSDPAGATSTFGYDENGQIATVSDALGHLWQIGHDPYNNPTHIITPTGSTFWYTFDTKGNLLYQNDPLGHSNQLAYDNLGDITRYTNSAGKVTSYQYSSQGDLLSITNPDGTGQQYSYDPLGNLTESIDGNGLATHLTYDSQGILTRKDFADGTHVAFTHDAHGNMLTATDVRGGVTSFAYDALGRLTRMTYPSGQYLAFSYDSAGRRSKSVDQSGFTINYQYDALGRLIRLTDGQAAPIASYSYDSVGRLTRKDLGNGTYTTYVYDVLGELTSLTNHAPNGSVNSYFDYTYDANGLRTSETTADGTTQYGYDADGQLISATLPSGEQFQYSYDSQGNRIQVVDNGVVTSYSSNSRNEYTQAGPTTYTYDKNGNLTSQSNGTVTTTYVYNSENQLVGTSGAAGTSTYIYDPFGNLTSAAAGGQTTQYMIDPAGLGQVVGTYDGSGNLIAHFTHGAGLVSRVDGNGPAYYDFDAIGSTAGITNAAGSYVNRYTYLPFGQTTTVTSALSNPFQFVGQDGVLAGTGNRLQMNFRSYDPQTGQFAQDDPLGLQGGSWNIRTYAANNPVSNIDPAGLGFGFFVAKMGFSPWLSLVQIGSEFIAPGGLRSCHLALYHEQFQPAPGDTVYQTPGQPVGFGANSQWYSDTSQGYFPIDPIPYDDATMAQAIAEIRAEYQKKGQQYDLLNRDGKVNCQQAASGLRDKYWDILIFSKIRHAIQTGLSEYLKNGDPNDLVGPAGAGPNRSVLPDATLAYTIDFENDPAIADIPVEDVRVTETLDPNLDWSTFELGSVGFGSTLVTLPPGLQSDQTSIASTNPDGTPLRVDIQVSFDLQTGVATWFFHSVDPATGTYPTGVFDGFLPVDDASHRGEGFVSYAARPRMGSTTGTTIRAQATIVFDVNAPLATNTFSNTIDAGPPSSAVLALPAVIHATTIPLSWSGSDDPSGSGIASYNVLVSIDGGPFTPFLIGTTATSATYTGSYGHSYAFYSVATDLVGHVQPTPAGAQATTRLALPTPILVQSLQTPLVKVVVGSGKKAKTVLERVIQIQFNGPVSGAASLGAYQLLSGTTTRVHNKLVTVYKKAVRLSSAAYNPATYRVTLSPASALNLGQLEQLTINATRIHDAYGQPLDGNHDGQPGGNYVATFSKAGVKPATVAIGAGASRQAAATSARAIEELIRENHHASRTRPTASLPLARAR